MCVCVCVCSPYSSDLRLECGDGFGCDVVAGDDLLEGVQEEVLPLRVGLNLGEDEGKISMEVTGTYTACVCVCVCVCVYR